MAVGRFPCSRQQLGRGPYPRGIRLGRQVVQNAGKLNFPPGPTSDRHTALQTNGLPHTGSY
eukprot:scaffold31070_cov46-Attheya_sp.AAC.7